MSQAKNMEGTYKIFFMQGCLTGMGQHHPLILLSPGDSNEQTWEVKRAEGDTYMIMLKGTQQGVSYPDDVFPQMPAMLGRPRCFRIIPAQHLAQGGEHFLVETAEGSSQGLMMAMSPAIMFPPRVALLPKDTPFVWCFKRC